MQPLRPPRKTLSPIIRKGALPKPLILQGVLEEDLKESDYIYEDLSSSEDEEDDKLFLHLPKVTHQPKPTLKLPPINVKALPSKSESLFRQGIACRK